MSCHGSRCEMMFFVRVTAAMMISLFKYCSFLLDIGLVPKFALLFLVRKFTTVTDPCVCKHTDLAANCRIRCCIFRMLQFHLTSGDTKYSLCFLNALTHCCAFSTPLRHLLMIVRLMLAVIARSVHADGVQCGSWISYASPWSRRVSQHS